RDDEPNTSRLKYLHARGRGLGIVLLAQTLFVVYAVSRTPNQPVGRAVTVGNTIDIGRARYTDYLLPVGIVGVMLLMAIVGSVVLARRLSQPALELVIDNEEERRSEELAS